MKRIGFIGVGIMGKSMVRNLMKAGYELNIFARTKAKVEDVIAEGAVFHDTIGECVKDCDAVITIVGFPKDVEEVYFDGGNILESAKEGAYLIDMTTTSPMIAEEIYQEGAKRGFHVLDAPVTGGDTGAKAGTLSILVGGDKADYEACVPLFEAMGTNLNYQGKAGCGQHAKLANQLISNIACHSRNPFYFCSCKPCNNRYNLICNLYFPNFIIFVYSITLFHGYNLLHHITPIITKLCIFCKLFCI